MTIDMMPADAREAIARARRISNESGLPGAKTDGPADALRHIVAAADLTLKYGSFAVRVVTLIGERISANYSDERYKMDVHNNYLGMNLALKYGANPAILREATKIIARGRFAGTQDRRNAVGLGAESDMRASWFSSPGNEKIPSDWQQRVERMEDWRQASAEKTAEENARKDAAREAAERAEKDREKTETPKEKDKEDDDKNKRHPPVSVGPRGRFAPDYDGTGTPPAHPLVRGMPTTVDEFQKLMIRRAISSNAVAFALELDRSTNLPPLAQELAEPNSSVFAQASQISAAIEQDATEPSRSSLRDAILREASPVLGDPRFTDPAPFRKR